ncbi:MAG: rod shape-determining protein [Limnochordia bacterium]|jgi:rod shape-determining protein MreB|nr:rod shape-determining protein [Limnochordia bacterium]MDD4518131.1 rod shape-determining protein [Limnochordia bacterium]
MIGRTPASVRVLQPLRQGTMAGHRISELILRYLVVRVCGQRRLFRPIAFISVPPKITTVEERAIAQAAYSAGAKQVHLVSEALLSGLGAGLDITQPRGHLVVNIGAGTTDVAVLSMHNEVVSESVRLGGEDFTQAIIRYLRRQRNLVVGDLTAEQVKLKVASVVPTDGQMEVKGQDYVLGLPKLERVSALELQGVLLECVEPIIATIVHVLEQTPPELSRDIWTSGMVLTGGGALLHGLAEVLEQATGVFVQVAPDPLLCVINGMQILMTAGQYSSGYAISSDHTAG